MWGKGYIRSYRERFDIALAIYTSVTNLEKESLQVSRPENRGEAVVNRCTQAPE